MGKPSTRHASDMASGTYEGRSRKLKGKGRVKKQRQETMKKEEAADDHDVEQLSDHLSDSTLGHGDAPSTTPADQGEIDSGASS